MQENTRLRELLQIHTDSQTDDKIEVEITSHEQQLQKAQDQYLALVKEEQDIQFNREIDEHKDIIQKIYDEELQKKTSKLEVELTDAIKRQVTEDLTAEITQRVEAETLQKREQELRAKLMEELTPKIKEELTEKLTMKLNHKYQKEFEQRCQNMAPVHQDLVQADQENREQMELLTVQNQSSLESGNN